MCHGHEKIFEQLRYWSYLDWIIQQFDNADFLVHTLTKIILTFGIMISTMNSLLISIVLIGVLMTAGKICSLN